MIDDGMNERGLSRYWRQAPCYSVIRQLEDSRKVNKNEKITILSILLCIYCLTGCQKAEAEIENARQEQETLEENSSEEDIVEENILEASDATDAPNYYHFVSDVDESSVYLGGAGGIYRVDSESGAQIIYPTPYISGAALYGDYVFSIEYNVTDSGMTADLIRINKDGSGKEIMTQISSGSYDLKIIDNMLTLIEEIIGNDGLETVFQYYILDDEGNLASDSPEDVYSQFELSDECGDDAHFLINPMFSTKYFGYSCFVRAVGETDVNSVLIIKGDEESSEEVFECSGEPLAAKDRFFYYDSNGETLVQHPLDNSQETVLYESSDDDILQLLTYDDEWIYAIRRPRIDEGNELSSCIMRVNLQDYRTEEIYEMQAGSYISNFNVYGNDCFFILSDSDHISRWECCNLTDFS
ncbi:MAG: hypothetical protein K2H31_01800 [Lachnospiraceae bacterium]|nr:hypothetical protein [Lachnospiraceae bacterium]